jgi:S1-C subfamily serine protease
VTAAALIAAPLFVASAAAQPGTPTPAPSTADPLPSVTAQGRASELVAPATAFVHVNWTANVLVEGVTWEPVQWSTGCTAVVVDPDGLLVTAGHCVDAGWDMGGAKRTAVEVLIQQYIEAGLLTESTGAALFDQVVAGVREWQVEGALNDSAPDREVHVTIGGGRAPWNSDPNAAPSGVEANVLDVKPWSEGDAALLKIEVKNLPVAVLAPESDVKVGQELVAVGYPLELANPGQSGALALTNRHGIIEAVDTQGQHGPGNRFYATSIGTAEGMSGGAVVNLPGQVVGLSSTVVGQSTSFIVPSSVVLENFGNRIKNSPGRIDELYRQGLTDYYAGYYTDAISKFEQVLLLVPDLPSVVDKKVDAAQRREQFGDQPKPVAPPPPAASSSWIPLLAVGGGIAALVGLMVVGLVFRQRRRRARQDDALPEPVPVPGDGAASSDDGPTGAEDGTVDPDGDGQSTEWMVRAATDGSRRVFGDDAGVDAMQPGAAPVATRSPARFCRSCGAAHEPDDAYCARCGSGLHGH